jgi:hypothetical protein
MHRFAPWEPSCAGGTKKFFHATVPENCLCITCRVGLGQNARDLSSHLIRGRFVSDRLDFSLAELTF